MWQRVQTLYLLVADFCLLTLLLFWPTLREAFSSLPWLGWLWLGLPVCASVLSTAAVALFRNRPLQMRLVRLAALLTAGSLGLSMALVINTGLVRSHLTIALGLVLLPLLAYVLLVRARRAIERDEEAVRRMHRLR
jgi:hypothetical protein